MSQKLAVILIVFALIIGVLGGRLLHRTPSPDDVRKELYTACANSDGGIALGMCSRQDIDLLLAKVYGYSYLPPLNPAPYEAELLKFKKN